MSACTALHIHATERQKKNSAAVHGQHPGQAQRTGGRGGWAEYETGCRSPMTTAWFRLLPVFDDSTVRGSKQRPDDRLCYTTCT
jgi:hypothetical protein